MRYCIFITVGIKIAVMDTLAKRLKHCRKRAGLTQVEISVRAGIRQPTYNRLEKGLTFSSANIAQIAHVLGVNAYWLATGNLPDSTTSFGKGWELLPINAVTA